MDSNIDDLSINTIRMLAVDAVEKANSGHPGLPMGAAAFTYTLWSKYLNFNPQDPHWFNRDRFVLSAGHGSMLLYSLLYLTGYNLGIDDLKEFRQWHSKTPGHPEHSHTEGVETTTGPLGQGFANAVGMAVGRNILANRFNKPEFEIIDYTTYALVSDGDLMEGISAEAASYAGSLQLNNLICFYDSNHVSIEGTTDITFLDDTFKRFEAYGWFVQEVSDGNNREMVSTAIEAAKSQVRPAMIIMRTHLGYGSPHKQDTAAAHGSALGPDEVKATKEFFNWPTDENFYVPEEALTNFRNIGQRGESIQRDWQAKFSDYALKYPELAKELTGLVENPKQQHSVKLDEFTDYSVELATREASGILMNQIADQLPLFVGGSADLAPSNNTNLKKYGDIEPGKWDSNSRNLHFGIREHAMGGILNGMALTPGIVPFGATFFCFSDYMRASIRLAAIMKLRVTYVLTHDSIGQGEDGTTHQPIEHLASLRAMPGLVTFRPGDANETVAGWEIALSRIDGPTALILTRQKLPTIDRQKYESAEGAKMGAYVIVKETSEQQPDLILIATGSEVSIAIEASELLSQQGHNIRVVSMPSTELFEMQDSKYRESILPKSNQSRLIIEAASSFGWYRYFNPDFGDIISVDTFGESAPGKTIMKEYGFSAENIVERAKLILNRKEN
jgi:transketolase